MDQPLLAVEDLEVVYGRHIPGLRGVSLDVGKGEVVALLGANGAGKTTLLRAITGLLPFHGGEVTAGRILLSGADVTRSSPTEVVRLGASQVMEGRRVFEEMSVEDNLATGAIVLGDRSATAQRREEMYELFPVLGDRRRSQAGYLSGGEQQMLAIARALMSSPALLLLDEPSLGLAPRIADQIRDVIVEINERGATVLVVEQNASMALSISARAYVLQTGTVALSGPSPQLQEDPMVQELYLGMAAQGGGSYRAARAGTAAP